MHMLCLDITGRKLWERVGQARMPPDPSRRPADAARCRSHALQMLPDVPQMPPDVVQIVSQDALLVVFASPFLKIDIGVCCIGWGRVLVRRISMWYQR